MSAIEAAEKAARGAMEASYRGVAMVTEHRKVRDEKSKLTSYREEAVLEGQPCRLSFERLQPAAQGEAAASVTQAIRLFLPPEVEVRANSKVTVTQAGVTRDYKSSGIAAAYPTHQEILLELFEEWG